MKRFYSLALLLSCSLSALHARADGDAPSALAELGSPYAPVLRAQYYEHLFKHPWRALGYELLAPGAGNFYVGLQAPAAITLGASLIGASITVAGALRDRPALLWSGVSLLAAGRAYGLVSAPVGAVLLNAAFRQQLGVSASY